MFLPASNLLCATYSATSPMTHKGMPVSRQYSTAKRFAAARISRARAAASVPISLPDFMRRSVT